MQISEFVCECELSYCPCFSALPLSCLDVAMTFYIAAIDISFNNFVMKQMVISQLKDVRTASKAFSTAQSSAMQVQKKLASEAKIPTT